MSSLSARVFRGSRALLSPASTATSKTSSTTVAASSKRKATKTKPEPEPEPKPKPKPKTRSASPAAKTPRKVPTSSGIFKPSPVSPALSQFLGKGEASRTDTIKEIWSYIKSHDLQNPGDRREIFCDEKLKLIFDGRDKVGFLEVGKLLARHFVKTD